MVGYHQYGTCGSKFSWKMLFKPAPSSALRSMMPPDVMMREGDRRMA
jgi:hypothetical protein